MHIIDVVPSKFNGVQHSFKPLLQCLFSSPTCHGEEVTQNHRHTKHWSEDLPHGINSHPLKECDEKNRINNDHQPPDQDKVAPPPCVFSVKELFHQLTAFCNHKNT